MNWKKPYVKALCFSLDRWIQNTANQLDIHMARVLRIDLPRRRLKLTGDKWTEYDWLISTIPLPYFLDLCHIRHHYRTTTTVYTVIEGKSKHLPTIVYFTQRHIPFHRITWTGRMGIVEQSSLRGDMANVRQYLLWVCVRNHFLGQGHIMYCRCYDKCLQKKTAMLEKYHVLLLGRYAQWTHKVKVAEVIERAKAIANKVVRK